MDHPQPIETATPKMMSTIYRARELTRAYSAAAPDDTSACRRILKELLGGIGENVLIDVPFHCDRGKNIFIGSNVLINMNCMFVDNMPIRIGNGVLIAPSVQIYTATHPVKAEERLPPSLSAEKTFYITCAAPVTIEDDVWIGGGSIILPGVTIGRGSVIGAGSVVTRDIPANCVAVGNPCRVLRQLNDSE